MRIALDRTGGRFPDGVVGTPVLAGDVPAEWIDPPDGVTTGSCCTCMAVATSPVRSIPIATSRAIWRVAMGCRVLALDYRLAPEHPHPAPVTDAVAGYRWLLDQGVAPEHIVIAGDSAGGGLTMATLLRSRDEGLPMPAAAVPISPMVDLEATGESMVTRGRRRPDDRSSHGVGDRAAVPR